MNIRKLMISLFLATLIIGGLYIILPPHVFGDLVQTTSHDDGLFLTSRTILFCRFCHVGFPSRTAQVSEDTKVLENYRCIACHMDVTNTQTLVHAFSNSSHRGIGCSFCHDTYHAGHQDYDTRDIGYYGCRDHEIVTTDLTPPSNPTVYFLNTYVVRRDTSPVSDMIDVIRWFYTTNIGTTTTDIFPYNFIDPYTGSPTDIPSGKRYWVCQKCHFTVETTRDTTTSNYWVTHPDTCYSCHSNTSGYGASTYNLEPHAVDNNAETYTWQACGSCHSGVSQSVSTSIHANVGCRCHSTLHISRYNSTGSWLYMYWPGSGLYATPTNLNFGDWRNIFFYNGSNSTTLSVPIKPVDVAGDPRYSLPFYAMRDGDASLITGQSFRILTCFNCHFVYDPATPASIEDAEGLIPIPSTALKNMDSPHTIQALNQGIGSGANGENNMLLLAVILLVSLLLLSIIILGRRR